DEETRIGRILAIVSTSNGTKLKIQHLYFGSELPRIFANSIRKERSRNGELLLSEIIYLTDPFNVIEPVTVWLQNTPELPNFQFYKIRDCKLRHLHPMEYTQIPMSAPHNVPTLKIMLDIYHDDFSTFRNVYHSLGGIYLQFCNMPLRLKKQLKNHFVLGFVPFGGEFDDLMKPIIDEIKILEKGTLMNIAGQHIWIIAALGVITADLPQGNDLADTKRHSGNQGCRSCLVPKERLSDLSFNIKLNARYHHITNKKINKLKELIQKGAPQKTVNDYCTEHGLTKRPSILNQLTRNRHLQTPQDAYHAIARKIQRLIDCTFSILNQRGKCTFLNYWKTFELPSGWYRLPNPIKHLNSFMFSD
ncbi:37503_t:CDS:2, partial [Gigaspora margarita]